MIANVYFAFASFLGILSGNEKGGKKTTITRLFHYIAQLALNPHTPPYLNP
jgi:hypothetical protein